mmetsp:Transcript_35061/g.99398  ORF Transcript_35061/g.99398 Transcript_35061/m.99398 type:complete len:280 (-) Transcript_35061:226-1065(-)
MADDAQVGVAPPFEATMAGDAPADAAADDKSSAREAAKAAELLHAATGERAMEGVTEFLRQLPANPSPAQLSVLLDLTRLALRFRPAAVHDRETVLRAVLVDCVDSMPTGEAPVKMMAWKDYLSLVKNLRTPGAAAKRPAGPATPAVTPNKSGNGSSVGGKNRKVDPEGFFPIDETTVFSIHAKRPKTELQGVTPRIFPGKEPGKSIYALDRPVQATNTLPDGTQVHSVAKKNRLVQVEAADDGPFLEAVKKLAEESNYGTNIPRHYFSNTVIRKFKWA